MKDKPSVFCPPDCKFVDVPIMCDTDCSHSKDREFSNPEQIEVKFGRGFKKVNVIGRNGDYLYLSDNTSININSPLIK